MSLGLKRGTVQLESHDKQWMRLLFKQSKRTVGYTNGASSLKPKLQTYIK